MRILLYKNEQSEDPVDITEAVKVLYDLAIGSMDFGSGFWNAEDAAPVAHLAELCEFENAESVRAYVSSQLQSEEQMQFLLESGRGPGWHYFGIPHEHVFSTQGKCLWPGCNERGF